MTNGTIPHSRPTLGEEEAKAVSEVIRSGYISRGDKVREFEQALARSVGVKGAVAVNSGTSAIHLGLIAMGIGKGDEVVLPSYVCTAPLNAVYMAGADPVICDIEIESFNISAETIERVRTKKTKAVIVPHMFGSPADIAKIKDLDTPVIEDCAQSIGAFYGKKAVGSLGKFSIASFYANKVMTTGEGGAILSDDAGLLDFARDRRDYDNKENYKLRYNYKMTDMQAAMGLAQILKLEKMAEARKALAAAYEKALEYTGLSLPKGEFDHIYYRYVVTVKKDIDGIISSLADKGVACARPVFKPINRYLGMRSGFRNTDEAYSTALSIPIYPSLSAKEQDKVISALREVMGG
jgi:perosamine synthetase